MSERVGEVPKASQDINLSPALQKRELSRWRHFALISPVLVLIFIAAACNGGESDPFGIEIPPEYRETSNEALKYAHEHAKGEDGSLVKNSDLEIQFGGGGNPDDPRLQNAALTLWIDTQDPEEFRDIKEEYGINLREFFGADIYCDPAFIVNSFPNE